MTPEENIIALEQEVADTRQAAVGMMLGMMDFMTRTPVERNKIARSFDEAAAGMDHATAQLAELVITAIINRSPRRPG